MKVEEQRQLLTQNSSKSEELVAANDMIDQLQQTLQESQNQGKYIFQHTESHFKNYTKNIRHIF